MPALVTTLTSCRRFRPCGTACVLWLVGSLLATARPTGVAAPPPNMVRTMPEKSLVDATPSRLVSDSAVQPYMNSVASQFLIQHQATDPFGCYQDPNAKPVIKKTVAKTTRRVAPAQATPFADVIRLLQINTVMPREKQFLIDSMTYRQGDTLSIRHRGRVIAAKIISVSSTQIQFQNAASAETASVSLNLLPAGMSAGQVGISAPGLVPTSQSNIIELDPGIQPDDAAPPLPPSTP